MAALCPHFVQNAWKKELCSNCFKSKEEHGATHVGGVGDGRSRYLATMFPSRPAPWRRGDPAPQSILRASRQPPRRPKGAGVRFPAEESQVIGFGGEECFSSDGEDSYESSTDSPLGSDNDDAADCEDERALQRLTRSNTDFNAVAANLLGTAAAGDSKQRTFSQLLLGQPLKDSEGRKKTLLVSVKPFGGSLEEADPPPVSFSTKSQLGKLLVPDPPEKIKKISATGKSSDIPTDKSGDIVLKSIKNTDDHVVKDEPLNLKTILDGQTNNEMNQELPDNVFLQSTAKQNDNDLTVTEETVNKLEEVSVKTVVQEVSNNVPESKTVCLRSVTGTTDTQPPQKQEEIIVTSPSKENVSIDEKVTSRIPVIKSRAVAEKPKTIIRTSAFNGRSDLPARSEEMLPKPATRKLSETNKLEIIPPKCETIPVPTLVVNTESQSIKTQIESGDEVREVKMKKDEQNTKQILKVLHSSSEGLISCTKPNLTMGISTEEVSENYETISQKFTMAEDKLHISNKKTEMTETNNSMKQTTSSSALVETHNLAMKSTEIVTKSIIVENKTFIASKESEKKSFKLDDLSNKLNSHKMQIKFGGIYKKIPVDEPVIQKDISKGVCTLSVRKIDGEPFLKTKIQDGEYKASKVMVEPLEKTGGEDLVFPVQESRELAGEPDGRADSDEMAEPPELPRSPPPVIDPRPSFLHGLVQSNARKTLPLGDKPKIPVKPNKVLQGNTARRQVQQQQPNVTQPPTTPVQSEPPELPSPTEVPGLESGRTPKRQAPKPPNPQTEEASSALPLFTRNPSAGQSKSSSPVAREKEKRERASSCSPKIRDTINQSPNGMPVQAVPCPEPAPRRSLSLSVESLTAAAAAVPIQVETEKKKSHGRARFSLRKFLRFGHHSGSKDEERNNANAAIPRADTVVPVIPLPRPRLEIIHPSDLNGSAVEVVRGDGTNVKQNQDDAGSTSSGSSDSKETEIMSCDSANSHSSSNSPTHCTAARPNKPPPPPRNQSLDAWGKALDGHNKPARPPPPKSAELLRQLKQPAVQTPAPAPTDNLYANLGEVRSALAPNKPQRTASIRDGNADGPKRKAAGGAQSEDSGYDSVELVNGKPAVQQHQMAGENVYECVGTGRSSSPECDSGLGKPAGRYGSPQRRSEGSMDTSPEFLKFRGSFVRSTSLPYCGSETESDIYSPYSFYGSEEGGEEDADWAPSNGHPWKTSRLRLRKGRSIVHKSLEDNYGAVIVANHEALSQVLEQINLGAAVPPALRGLKTAVNLRWTDFTLPEEPRAMAVGRRVFQPAQWVSHHVTLCLTVDQGLQSSLPSRGGTSTLVPLTEFSDLVPARYLPAHPKGKAELVQASVAVLTKLHVDTIRSYGCFLRERVHASSEEHWKDSSFVLLQLVNGLKLLQAQGIEEVPLSLSSFVLCREDRDPQPRLCILHELNAGVPRGESDEERGSLCQCALAALRELLPVSPLAPLVSELLTQERAVSLSRVKSVLEFSLWGPADVALGVPPADRELALQRWLDLERATVLHGLVRTRIELTPFEECHLLFLVRTNAKMMSEASLLIDSHRNPESTSF